MEGHRGTLRNPWWWHWGNWWEHLRIQKSIKESMVTLRNPWGHLGIHENTLGSRGAIKNN